MIDNPLRVDELRAENFRGFESLKVRFDPSFNVLIGDNAAGKTSVLDALAIVLSQWSAAAGVVPAAIEPSDLRIVANNSNGVVRLDQPFACKLDAVVAGRKASLSREGPNSKSVKQNFWLYQEAEVALKQAGKEGGATLPVVAHYPAHRNDGGWTGRQSVNQHGQLERKAAYNNALPVLLAQSHFPTWMERQAFVTFQDEGHEAPASSTLRNALRDVVPGATEVRYLAKAESVVVTFEDGHTLPVDRLSAGQRAMLTLFGDIGWRMVQLNPELGERVLTETPGVVLIDELSLHLHPRWQRRIAADLRRTFPLVQFIVATHSPLIVGEVKSECVLVMGTGRAEVPTAQQSYGLSANQVLTRVMGAEAVQPDEVTELLAGARHAVRERRLDDAQTLSDRVQGLQRGATPETIELDTTIANLEALADDADDQ